MLKINDLISSGESFNMNRNRASFYESVEIRTLVKESSLEVNRELLSNFINKSTRGESDSTKTTKPGFFGKVLTWLKKIWGWIVTAWKKIVDGIRGAASKIKKKIMKLWRKKQASKESVNPNSKAHKELIEKEEREAPEYERAWYKNDMDSKFSKDLTTKTKGLNDNTTSDHHFTERSTFGQIKWSVVDEAIYGMDKELLPGILYYLNYLKMPVDKRTKLTANSRHMDIFRKYGQGAVRAEKISQPFTVFESLAKRQVSEGKPFPEKEFEELEKRLDDLESVAKKLWKAFKEMYDLIQQTKISENDYTEEEKMVMQMIAKGAYMCTYNCQIFGALGDRNLTDMSLLESVPGKYPGGAPHKYLVQDF